MKSQCPACKGHRVKTDENGVQYDEPCDECAVYGFIFDEEDDYDVEN